MQVELTCADAFDPIPGLVARGLVARHRTSREGAGGVGATQDLGFEALTPAVHRRAAEAIAAVARRWVVAFSETRPARNLRGSTTRGLGSPVARPARAGSDSTDAAGGTPRWAYG